MIAEAHLTPATRAAVDQLLQADTDTLTEPDIASRATWADKYRDSDRSTTGIRYHLTRAWHFVDIELDNPNLAAACFGHPPAARPASQGPAEACVVDRIEACSAELRELPTTSPERTIAFKFVLHLVGDVHQPLHAADNHDAGGNGELILFANRRVGRKLHAYWDSTVVRKLGTSPAKVAAALDERLGGRCAEWMHGAPADWAMESFGVARDLAYRIGSDRTVDDHDQPAYRLSPEYQQRAPEVAAEQLEKAGCSPDRKGEHPRGHLATFRGILQADGYAGFAELYGDGRVVEAACLAHGRRKFWDVYQATKSPLALEALNRIAALYRIEDAIRGHPPD